MIRGFIVGDYVATHNLRVNRFLAAKNHASEFFTKFAGHLSAHRKPDFLALEEKTAHCSVQDKPCQTEEEWRALIKPFMED